MKGTVVKKQAGFTLIELLVYIAILVSAVVIIGIFTVDITSAGRSEEGNRNTQQNARFAIERLQFETRWANDVSQTNTNEVTLQTAGGQVRFYIASGDAGQDALFIERDGIGQQLTSDSVEVTTFDVPIIETGTSLPSVDVSLVVEDNAIGSNAQTSIDTVISVREH
jgi:type II secretory pathway pseudopilin PulG